MSNNECDLENYKFIKTIGEGTFGKVKLSIHLPTKEYVAIKILEKSKVIEQMGLERIEREIEYLKFFNHPNIIQIYEVIDSPKNFYIVMEYASCGELFHYIVNHKRLDEKEASFFFTQIIYGIREIHKRKICHRDIKPENLLLTENKTIKIIDFGLSKEYVDTLKSQSGSPCYAAPEMIRGNDYSGLLVDIWACGINLYAMICGFLPFDDKDNNVVFDKILQCELLFPDEKKIYVSDEAKDLIMKILNPNPAKRLKIDEILSHPFLKSGIQEYNNKVLKNNNICQDNVIIDYMVNKLKFSNKNRYISNLIKTNVFNNITTTYKLIKKKILEGRFDFNYIEKIKENNTFNSNNNSNSNTLIKNNNITNIKVNLRRKINRNINNFSIMNKRNKNKIGANNINSKSEDKNLRTTRKNRYKLTSSRIKPFNNNILLTTTTYVPTKDYYVHQKAMPNDKSQNRRNNERYITCVSEGKRRIYTNTKAIIKTPPKTIENPFIYDNNNKRNINTRKIRTNFNLGNAPSNEIKQIQIKINKIRSIGELSPYQEKRHKRQLALNADVELKTNLVKSNDINNSKNKSIIRVRKRNINNKGKRNVDIISEQSTNITNATLTSVNRESNNFNFKTIEAHLRIPIIKDNKGHRYNKNNIDKENKENKENKELKGNKENIDSKGHKNNKDNKDNTDIDDLLINRLKRSVIAKNHNKIKSNTLNRIVIPDQNNCNNNNEMNTDTDKDNNFINYNNYNQRLNALTSNNQNESNLLNNNFINPRRNNRAYINVRTEEKYMRNTYDESINKIKSGMKNGIRSGMKGKCTPITLRFKNSFLIKEDDPNYIKTDYNDNYNKTMLSIRNKYKDKHHTDVKTFLIVKTNSKTQLIKNKLISFCNRNNYRYNNYKGWKYTVFIDYINSFILEINSEENDEKYKLYHNTGSELVTKENMDKLSQEINII